jgi:hypothetical protein
MLRAFPLLYSAVRRLKIIDATFLLHLPSQSEATLAESQATLAMGYSIRAVPKDQLVQLLKNNLLDAAVGDPDKLDDPRRVLVAAFQGDQIVSFLWVADEAVDGGDNYSRSEHLGTSITMPDGTVFLYNAWTSPEHRGKRLIAALLRWTLEHRVCGARSCLTMIDWTNERSIRAFEYLGMKRLGWVLRFGRGRLQFSFVPHRAEKLGLTVAEQAPGAKFAW